MKLITKEQRKRMIANARKREALGLSPEEFDVMPVVRIIDETGETLALLSEVDPDCPNWAFGLCQCGGIVFDEVDIADLEKPVDLKTHPLAAQYFRDRNWKADKTLAEYAAISREAGRIIA